MVHNLFCCFEVSASNKTRIVVQLFSDPLVRFSLHQILDMKNKGLLSLTLISKLSPHIA